MWNNSILEGHDQIDVVAVAVAVAVAVSVWRGSNMDWLLLIIVVGVKFCYCYYCGKKENLSNRVGLVEIISITSIGAEKCEP